jgi:hypothetical protein
VRSFTLSPRVKAKPKPPEEPKAANRRAAREQPKRLVSFGLTLCLLLCLGTGGVWLSDFLPTLAPANSAPARGAIFYVTAGGALKFKSASIETPRVLVENYNAGVPPLGVRYAIAGANGRYAAYINNVNENIGELSLRDFSATRPGDAEPAPDILISRSVRADSFFFANAGSRIVFLDAQSRLCSTDYEQVFVLDLDISEMLAHSDEQILYTKYNGDTLNLYVMNTDAGEGTANPRLVANRFERLADCTESLERLIYVRENADGSRDLAAADTRRNTTQTLAIGIDEVLAADAETNSALYRTKAANTFGYGNFIEDAFAESDEQMPEPSYDNYPGLEDFYENMDLDTDDEEPEPDTDTETDGEDEGEDSELVEDELAEEIQMYAADVLNYEDKLDRDMYRAEVRDALDAFLEMYPSLYTLHLYRAGSAVKLASNSLTPFADAGMDAENAVCAWASTELTGFEKVDMARYEEMFAVGTPTEYLLDAVSDNLYLQSRSNPPERVYLGEGAFSSGGWALTQRGDGVFFAMNAGSPALGADRPFNLYYKLVSGTTIMQVDENVSALGEMLDGNRLLYYKELENGVCDLYLMTDLIAERIGDRASLSPEYLKVENDSRTLLYAERFEREASSGNLYMLTRQNRQLATDVSRVFYRSDSLVYFLRAPSAGGAASELYAFQSSGLAPVEADVLWVFE